MKTKPFAKLSDSNIIAQAIIVELKNQIGNNAIEVIARLNRSETDPTICHSQKFCHSDNVNDSVLDDCGFMSVNDLCKDDNTDDEFQSGLDQIRLVCNNAWDIAKKAHFNLTILEKQIEEHRIMNADKFTEIANTAGWSVYNTGGGCMALHHQPTESDYPHFLATHNDDADLPQWGSDVNVSMYRTEDDQGSEIAFKLEFSDDIDGCGNAGYSIERVGAADPYSGPTDPLDGMSICDPTVSDCGRFDVNSVDHYGIPAPIANLMHALYLFAQEQSEGEY